MALNAIAPALRRYVANNDRIYTTHAGLAHAARKMLTAKVRATHCKDGLIAVEVDDTDPEYAAKLANAHVEELHKLLGRLAVTEAQQRRLFFEKLELPQFTGRFAVLD